MLEPVVSDCGIVHRGLHRRMAEHCPDRRQGDAMAEHLGRRGMTEHRCPMDRGLHLSPVHRPRGNLPHWLVRQALEWRAGGQEDMRVVHRGTLVEGVQEGVPDRLRER